MRYIQTYANDNLFGWCYFNEVFFRPVSIIFTIWLIAASTNQVVSSFIQSAPALNTSIYICFELMLYWSLHALVQLICFYSTLYINCLFFRCLSLVSITEVADDVADFWVGYLNAVFLFALSTSIFDVIVISLIFYSRRIYSGHAHIHISHSFARKLCSFRIKYFIFINKTFLASKLSFWFLFIPSFFLILFYF